ncbi:MAG: 50S ribosomal protein L31 [Gammaproteobacteria bacterium]|nr:50S ribosomal protein L31 [Gammaproteobacteria bacterium]
MKKDTHPAFHEVAFTCSCGNIVKTGSTMQKDKSHIDVCSKCHPFYTGKQKISDAGGRLTKFRKKYGDNAEKAGDTAE